MASDQYILNDKGEPTPEPNVCAWARWYEMSWPARQVAREKFGHYTVSTVFLGLNHNSDDNGPPILWETMTFRGDCEETDCDRCTGGREQAEAMHAAMVERVKSMERF